MNAFTYKASKPLGSGKSAVVHRGQLTTGNRESIAVKKFKRGNPAERAISDIAYPSVSSYLRCKFHLACTIADANVAHGVCKMKHVFLQDVVTKRLARHLPLLVNVQLTGPFLQEVSALTALYNIPRVIRCFGTFQEQQSAQHTQIIVLERLEGWTAVKYLTKVRRLSQSPPFASISTCCWSGFLCR
jgi:hypothetical protein